MRMETIGTNINTTTRLDCKSEKCKQNGYATEFTGNATYANQEVTKTTSKMADTETRQYWGPPFSNGNDLEKHPWTCTNTTAGMKARNLECKREKAHTNTKSNRRKFLEHRKYHKTEITTAGDNIAATQREARNNGKLSQKQSRGKTWKTKKQANR